MTTKQIPFPKTSKISKEDRQRDEIPQSEKEKFKKEQEEFERNPKIKLNVENELKYRICKPFPESTSTLYVYSLIPIHLDFSNSE
jgi:hypothetical protein